MLKFTVEVETNPVPFTVSVNAGPPTTALAGESEVIAGVGFAAPFTMVGSLNVLFAFPGAASPGSETVVTFVTLGTAACATATVIESPEFPPAGITPPPINGATVKVHVTTWPEAVHVHWPFAGEVIARACWPLDAFPGGGPGKVPMMLPPETNVKPVGSVSVTVNCPATVGALPTLVTEKL